MKQYKTKQEQIAFYKSSAWQSLRLEALERDNHECVWCKEDGRVTIRHDAVLEVDHIKEIEHHPELALELDNLQVLCKTCHNRKHKRFNGKKNKWFDDEKW